MSKTTLKKHLQSLTKKQLIGQVLGLFDTCKPAKEYLEYMLNPNEKEKFKLRCQNCVKYAEPCGYGFADEISDLFSEYYE